MANKRHTPEQVINKLRQAEVAISAGRTVSEASLLATSKNGTLCYPRDQVMDEGPVSSLRALL